MNAKALAAALLKAGLAAATDPTGLSSAVTLGQGLVSMLLSKKEKPKLDSIEKVLEQHLAAIAPGGVFENFVGSTAEALIRDGGDPALHLAGGATPAQAADRRLRDGANRLALSEWERGHDQIRRVLVSFYAAIAAEPNVLRDLANLLITHLNELSARVTAGQGKLEDLLRAQDEAIAGLRDDMLTALAAFVRGVNAGRVLVTRQVRLPSGPMADSSCILRAEYGVVPFHAAREDELADLAEWRDDTKRGLAIRLYIGGGGVGKTRLMIEATARARAAGWRAGFLDPEVAARGPDALELLVAEGPLLVVVDYAEGKADLVLDLIKIAGQANGHVRLILLGRDKGTWWDTKHREGYGPEQDLLYGAEARAPEHLFIGMDHRATIFREAFAAFAAPDAAPPADPPLGADHFGTMLYLHIAALAAANGERIWEAEALLDWALNRDVAQWSRLRDQRTDLPAAVGNHQLTDAACLATLALAAPPEGATGLPDARAIVAATPGLRDLGEAARENTVLLLGAMLATTDDAAAHQIDAVRPDLIGERLVERAALWGKDANRELLEIALSGPLGDTAPSLALQRSRSA